MNRRLLMRIYRFKTAAEWIDSHIYPRPWGRVYRWLCYRPRIYILSVKLKGTKNHESKIKISLAQI